MDSRREGLPMMVQGLRGVSCLLEDVEATADLLRDAIDASDVIDWDMYAPHLAEGAKHALKAGQVAMIEQVINNTRDALAELRRVEEGC